MPPPAAHSSSDQAPSLWARLFPNLISGVANGQKRYCTALGEARRDRTCAWRRCRPDLSFESGAVCLDMIGRRGNTNGRRTEHVNWLFRIYIACYGRRMTRWAAVFTIWNWTTRRDPCCRPETSLVWLTDSHESSHLAKLLRQRPIVGLIRRQKSSWLSRCVRFVIADHSPERVLETGLLVRAPEKNTCNESEIALASFSSGPVCIANVAKIRPFSLIPTATEQNFSAVETTWRREVDSNPRYAFCNPIIFSILKLPSSPSRVD